MAQLDASLIGGFKGIDIPDPINQLQKMLTIRALQGQGQLQDLQIGTAQGTANETNALRQYLSDPATAALDPAARMAGIQRNAPIIGQPIVKGMLDAQKTQGEIQKTSLDNEHAQIQATASLIGAAAQQGGPQAVMETLQQSPTVPESMRARLLQAAQANPLGFAKQFVQSALTPEQQVTQSNPTLMPTENGIAAVSKDGSGGRMVPNVSGAASYLNGMPGVGPGIGPNAAPTAGPQTINQPYVGQQPAGNFVGDPASILATLQRITNPADRVAAIRALQNQLAGANPTPGPNGMEGLGAQAPVTIGSGGGQQQQVGGFAAPASNLGAKREEIVYHNDPITGQVMSLPKFAAAGTGPPVGGAVGVGTQPGAKLSPADQAVVDQIGKYQMAPPNGMALRSPRMAQIMGALAEQYPNFQADEFPARQKALKDFSTGSQGNSLRSFAVAVDHLSSLSDLTDALNNGNYPLVNKLANLWAQNTGSTGPTSFDAAKEIVGKEVVKAIVSGGGGVGERSRIAELLSNAKSPAQLKAIIGEYTTLMAAQRDGLVAQYENTTGRTDAATRFNFAKKGGTPPPIPQATVDALLQKYGTAP